MNVQRHQTDGLLADDLYVALTRPALAFGVPYAAVLATGILTIETFLISRNLLTLTLALPLYGACRLLTANEPRFFELWLLWATHAATDLRTRRQWGAKTRSPLPAQPDAWIQP